MNLEYAAYLLNENHIINEDANSAGQDGALLWLQQNYPMEEFGIEGDEPNLNAAGQQEQINYRGRMQPSTRALAMAREVQEYFGHFATRAAKGTYKFLPGAVRIAVLECGYLSDHENMRKLQQLQIMYCAAYYEWRDGIAAGLRSGNQQYQGLLNKDFIKNNQNGQPVGEPLTFNQLKEFLGADRIAQAKERMIADNRARDAEEAARNGTAIETEEQRREREAREEAERIRRSTAGAYHIEYIPNWEESKKWYKYTNPCSRSAGCHWCITEPEDRGHWDSYMRKWHGSVYFCWKAESKEALLAMNEDSRWFSDWEDIPNAPKNEYGLSMICIMVSADPDGIPRFRQATSRYNHYGPDGEWNDGSLYGDCLVTKASDCTEKNERGLREICAILNIPKEEFFDKFPLRANADENGVVHDHNALIGVVAANTKSVPKLMDDLYRQFDIQYDDELIASDYVNIVPFKHDGEYNFINALGKLISPNQWFADFKPLYDENNKTIAYKVRFIVNGNEKYNIVDVYGDMMLDQDVANIYTSRRTAYTPETYVKIEVRNSLYNIFNVKNKCFLLRKPVADVLLQTKYSKTICIKKDSTSNWETIDIKGKTIARLPFKIRNEDPVFNISTNLITGEMENGAKIVFNKNTNKIIFKGRKNITNVCNDYFTIKDNDKYAIYNANGELVVNNATRIGSVEYNNSRYACYREGGNSNYIVVDVYTKEKIDDLSVSDISDLFTFKNVLKYRDKFYVNNSMLSYNLASTYPEIIDNRYVLLNYNDNTDGVYDTVENRFILDKRKGVKKVLYNGGTWLLYYGQNKVTFNDSDLSVLAEYNNIDIDNTSIINVPGYFCVTITNSQSQTNKKVIIKPDGKPLLKLPFKRMLSYFTDSGYATIEAGASGTVYYINLYGDVSTTFERLTESMLTKLGINLINEKTTIKPKRNLILERAMFLLD